MKSTGQLLDIVTQATIVLNSAHKYSARQRQYHATQLGFIFEYLQVIKKTKKGNIRPK
jgi:hypothetical protein